MDDHVRSLFEIANLFLLEFRWFNDLFFKKFVNFCLGIYRPKLFVMMFAGSNGTIDAMVSRYAILTTGAKYLECVFVNSALKIQCHIVKNTPLQTAFSAILFRLSCLSMAGKLKFTQTKIQLF